MNRDAFEQLVNTWLAEPDRDELKTQIDAAIEAEPELANVLDEWRRFDELLRRGCPVPGGVDWSRFKTRVVAAAAQDARDEDDLLNAALRELPSVDDHVHWSRFHARVMAALTRSGVRWASRPPETAFRRRRYTRVVAGAATLLAAAAALFLAILPHNGPLATGQGLVRVQVSAPPASGNGVAYVHIAGAPAAAASPERFFAVDPLPKSAPSAETADYY
jgi:hypothetical protein